MTPYTYERAGSLAEAIELRRRAGTWLLAGGTDLIAQMKAGRHAPAHVIDVKRVPEMSAVNEMADGGLEIGAAVSAVTLARTGAVRRHHGGLHDALQMIGSLQIQNRATLGGNICNAAPSADAVPALIADGAVARVAGSGGERMEPLEALFAGPGRTHLGDGDVLVSLRLPKPVRRSASAYLRFTPRREMDIAVVGAGVRIELDGGGMIRAARVALASVAPTPVRAPSAEAQLVGQVLSGDVIDAAAAAARDDASPISDTRASADYRRHLVSVLVRRALVASASRLGLEVSRA